MASSNEGHWISDVIHDFIHSSVWLSPIQTFVDKNCASFNIDEQDESTNSLNEEESAIYRKYRKLAESLIDGLAIDFQLETNILRQYYNRKESITTDESYEQLFSINNIHLFKDMMRKRNLILQLQALVNLQLEYGLMKPSDANDDRILQLLMKATTNNKPSGILATHKSTGEQNDRSDVDEKHVNQRQSLTIIENDKETIDSVPETMLRQKFQELSFDNSTEPSYLRDSREIILSRKDFLQKQRDLLIEKQRHERSKALEEETLYNRPLSASKIARQAMKIEENEQSNISEVELERRRALAAKLRRELFDKN